MNKMLGETLYVRHAIPIDDLNTTAESAAYYDMDDARKVIAIAHCAEHTDGEWFRVRLKCAEDNTGTNDESIDHLDDTDASGWKSVDAPAGNGPVMVELEADVHDLNLSDDKHFVGVEIAAESQIAAGAGCVLVFGDLRYKPTD